MSIEIIMKSLDSVEKKLNDLQTLEVQQREFADRLFSLEQKGSMPRGETLGLTKTYGQQLVELLAKPENSDLLSKTRSVRFEIKAAGDPITTTEGRTVVSGGVGTPGASIVGIQNGLNQRSIGSVSAFEYSRFTGTIVGSAAQQATEGADKSALRPSFTLINQSALTIAGWTKMSRQSMSDSAELRRAIDITLTREVGKALDVALVNGATNFTGGFEALATSYTSLTYTRLLDAVSEAVATMQVAGFAPDMVVMSPADWLAVTVATGSDGHYLSGNYIGALGQEARDLRVVLSPSIDAGKALVMDSAHTELLNVGAFSIEVAYSGDDFTKNLVTVLGEQRVIPVFRSVGSARLITPKAP